MKSLVRWGATLGLIGSTILGTWFEPNLRAFALPEPEIVQKLNQVPVFFIADEQGNLITRSINVEGQEINIAGIFMSQGDAQNFFNKLSESQPNIAAKVNVLPGLLGNLYRIVSQNQENLNEVIFEFVPMQEQVRSAVALLGGQNEDVEKFKGVPLFFATVKKDDREAYLTSDEGSIPLFFEKEHLDNLLKEFKQEKPEIASNMEISINVVALEIVINQFQNNESELLSNMVLVPSKQSGQYIQSLQQNRNQSQPVSSP